MPPLWRETMNETKEEKESYFGATLTLTENVICNDGSKFEDYTWEEHLHYNCLCNDECVICGGKL